MRNLLLILASFVALVGCSTPKLQGPPDPVEVTQTRLEAEELVRNSEYKEAAKKYKHLAFICQNDKSAEALAKFRQAECYQMAGKIGKAWEIYQDLLSHKRLLLPFDQVIERLRQLAVCYENGQGTFLGLCDTTTAIKIYKLIIQDCPSIHVSLEDRYKYASLLEDDGKLQEAANAFLQAIKKDPENAEIRLRLAGLYMRLANDGIGNQDGNLVQAAIREANAFLRLCDEDDIEGKEIAQEILNDAYNAKASRLLQQAKFYRRKQSNRPAASKRYLEQILAEYPETDAAIEARTMLKAAQEAEIKKAAQEAEAKMKAEEEEARKAAQEAEAKMKAEEEEAKKAAQEAEANKESQEDSPSPSAETEK